MDMTVGEFNALVGKLRQITTPSWFFPDEMAMEKFKNADPADRDFLLWVLIRNQMDAPELGISQEVIKEDILDLVPTLYHIMDNGVEIPIQTLLPEIWETNRFQTSQEDTSWEETRTPSEG